MVEEEGCQACEKLSLGKIFRWGSDFSWRESNTSYGALRIPDPAYCRDPKEGSGEANGPWNSEGVYSRGGMGMWEWASMSSGCKKALRDNPSSGTVHVHITSA